MDTLSLPLIEAATPLREALNRMRGMGRSGAVYVQEEQYWLVEAPDVVVKLAETNAMVGSMPRQPIRLVDVAEIARKTPGPIMHLENLSADLTASGAQFGVLASNDSQVFVATVSETLQTMLAAGPAGCYCTRRHSVSGCSTGDACPTGDGGTVYCSFG